MTMTKEELAAKIEAHVKWLKTRNTSNVEGSRADLTGADLTRADLADADLTGANLNIWKASPFVLDALAAVASAQIAMKKTRIEWMNN